MLAKTLSLILLIFLTGCFSLSQPVSLPVDKFDTVLRASIVKDLSFIIREKGDNENDFFYEINIWRGVQFSNPEKDVLIDKARRVNDDWDGN